MSLKKIYLLSLIFSLTFVSVNAQKRNAKNRTDKKIAVQQKNDDWKEYRQSDFTVRFPQTPTETNDVFQLADKSVRYSAVGADGIRYSVERLEFGEEFWRLLKNSDEHKTIYDNLEMQQTALGATLLFGTTIFLQSVSGRTAYFKLPDENGEAWDLMQNAFKHGDTVYVVRAKMPVKLMNDKATGLKDFPPPVKVFLDSFRFLFEIKESNDFLPPPPPAPSKPKGTPNGKP